MRRYFIAILFLLFSNQLAQAQCDTIQTLLYNLKELRFVASGTNREIDILNTLAQLYRDQEEIKNSYDNAKYAEILARKNNYKRGKALALLNLGQVQYEIEGLSIEGVQKSFAEAIATYKELKDDTMLANTYAQYGLFYQNQGLIERDYLDSATYHLVNAYNMYDDLGIKEKAAEVADAVAEVYYAQDNDEKALEYSKKYIQASGAQFSKAKIITRSLENQAKIYQYFIFSLVGGLFLMLVLAFALIKGMQRTNRINKVLEQQKATLIENNEKIQRQKEAIDKKNTEIEEAMTIVKTRNKEIDRQYKQILLQQEEIEMRNDELGEKNEELQQQREEIISQRDNMERQAKELEIKANELQASYKTITILSRIGQSITSTLDFKEILDTFYAYVTELMSADGFRVYEYQPENNTLQYKFNTELQKKRPLISVSMSDNLNPAVWCVKNARSIFVNRKEDLTRYDLDHYSINSRFNSTIFYPLMEENEAIGAVGIYSRKKDAYDYQQLDMIKTLASYVTIALKNAKTYQLLNTAQEQLVESEKMAALGNLVAGVAHEINTPVGICVTAASKLDTKTQSFKNLYAEGKMKRKDLNDFIALSDQGSKIILTNARRAADLVQGFKRVAVEQSSENRRSFNVKEYMEETIMALKPEFKNKPYRIKLDIEPGLEINSYPGAFSQIITNLVMNSLIHGFKDRDQGEIKIKVRQQYNYVLLTYTDNGKGMSEEVKKNIYEPFFTTNRDEGGTGLGMNIVYNLIAQKLGGKIHLVSAPNKGVFFTIEIPISTS